MAILGVKMPPPIKTSVYASDGRPSAMCSVVPDGWPHHTAAKCKPAGMVSYEAAADLGMFSMFGRTGAPQKGAPTRAAANFFACRK